MFISSFVFLIINFFFYSRSFQFLCAILLTNELPHFCYVLLCLGRFIYQRVTSLLGGLIYLCFFYFFGKAYFLKSYLNVRSLFRFTHQRVTSLFFLCHGLLAKKLPHQFFFVQVYLPKSYLPVLSLCRFTYQRVISLSDCLVYSHSS